jgi:peptidyl-prolyl cis-trans isomerase C
MPRASARHILVDTEEKCSELKQEIINGASFAEFDQVVFNEALNVVHGPIKTQFGYHLLEITERSE